MGCAASGADLRLTSSRCSRRVAQPSATPAPARPVRSSLASGSVRYSRPSRDACGDLSGPGDPGTRQGIAQRVTAARSQLKEAP
jgi:hypothetical protein